MAPLADSRVQVGTLRTTAQSLELNWLDDHTSEFEWIWLRDNCQCAACVHPQTFERTFDLLTVPLNIQARDVLLSPETGDIRIIWDDGHESLFCPEWLRERCCCEADRIARSKRSLSIWGAESEDRMPTITFQELMSSDAKFLGWCKALHVFGLTLVRGVPPSRGQVVRFASKVGHVWTHKFGSFFDVTAVANPDSTAYTALPLPLHTDLPSRGRQPGFQFLHCLVHDTGGGESIFVDGFRLVETLRNEDPDALNLLATEEIVYRYVNDGGEYRFRSSVLKLGKLGEPLEVRFNPFLLEPLDLPSHKIRPYYAAWRKFQALTTDRRFQIRFCLKAGDLVVFDNHRILHARTAIDLGCGHRHLQGCYLERDELYSRIRLLEKALALQRAHQAHAC